MAALKGGRVGGSSAQFEFADIKLISTAAEASRVHRQCSSLNWGVRFIFLFKAKSQSPLAPKVVGCPRGNLVFFLATVAHF